MIKVKPRERRQVIVLVNLDNVLLDFETQFMRKFRTIYPDQPYVPCDQRDTFDIRKQYEELPGSACNIKEMVQSIYRGKHFFRGAPEIDGGIDAIKEMARMDGVDVFIICTPLFDVSDYKTATSQYDWVKDHLGTSWLSKLILTTDITVIKGHLLIDDRIDIKGAIKRPSWEHIVFTTCHNQHANTGERTRLYNWNDGEWFDIIQEFRQNQFLRMD